MANDVGYLREADIPALKVWLNHCGVGWNPGLGLWEVIRIAYGGHTCVVTRNKMEHYKTPVELRPLLLDFRKFMESHEPITETSEITDSVRLEFLLRKGRQVVTEIEGWGSEGRHYAIYVTQGTMGDHEFPAVRFTRGDDFDSTSEEAFKFKREAIDLAIHEDRNQVREKSN